MPEPQDRPVTSAPASPDPEDIIVTTGGLQALDLIAKTLVDPGDAVICEAPTYPGAVPVFCSYEAETHGRDAISR